MTTTGSRTETTRIGGVPVNNTGSSTETTHIGGAPVNSTGRKTASGSRIVSTHIGSVPETNTGSSTVNTHIGGAPVNSTGSKTVKSTVSPTNPDRLEWLLAYAEYQDHAGITSLVAHIATHLNVLPDALTRFDKQYMFDEHVQSLLARGLSVTRIRLPVDWDTDRWRRDDWDTSTWQERR